MLQRLAIRGSLRVFWNQCEKVDRVKGVFALHLLFIAIKGECNAFLSLKKKTTEPMTGMDG